MKCICGRKHSVSTEYLAIYEGDDVEYLIAVRCPTHTDTEEKRVQFAKYMNIQGKLTIVLPNGNRHSYGNRGQPK